MKKVTVGELFAALLLVSNLSAQTSSVTQLEDSSIVGNQSDLINSIERSQAEIATVPGGSSIIDVEGLVGQIVKPEDLFKFDPGVYAQSQGTSNDSRLAVRGSGIQRRFGQRGLTLLLDGIPANDSDGSYYFRAIDPQSISYIESHRGGNGLRFGGTQLGGAINIQQKNGITHPGGELSLEFGSFETIRTHLEVGGSQGKWDWFAGYSYAESDGFRDHQDWRAHHITANLGYHWNDENVTRFYGLFSNSDAFLSGGLTPEEFAADPQQQQPGLSDETNRDLTTIRFGQITRWATRRGEWKFYTNYQYLDLDHITGLGPGAFNNLIDFDTDSFQIGLRGTHEYHFAGLDHKVHTEFSADYGRNEVGGFSGFVPPFSSVTPGINDRDDRSRNVNIYVENDTTFNEDHHLIAGVGYNWADRERKINGNDENSTPFRSIDEGIVGKVGYLYEYGDDSQFYANVSRSFEAVPFVEGGDVADASPQTALTYEIGTRYKKGSLTAELTTYLTKASNEFVFEETAANSGVFNVTNADTTRFGIESALSANLNDAFGIDSGINYDLLVSYQYNDFTFDDGTADGNQIPVISRHVIASQLQVSGEKWKTALSVDWLPEGLFADNLNTLSTPGYATVDLAVEYQLKEGILLSAGITNLFDKDFASTVTVNPDPGSGFISPGDGRSAYVGFKYSW